MKKIVALGAIAALACGMAFADEPAIGLELAELSGNAQVKWGVDLDAGQHGFSNSNEATLKVNLWKEGTKETTADDAIGGGDIWAEIQVKGKASARKNNAWDGDGNASLEKAILHIGPHFYINIKSGDLKVGDYKPQAAVHGDNPLIADYGYATFSNGIEAGWDDPAYKFSLGFRSYKGKGTDYTSAYGMKIAAELKDGDDALVPGLSVSGAFALNLSTDYKDTKDSKIEGYTDKTGTLADHAAVIYDWDKKQLKGLVWEGTLKNIAKDGRTFDYGVKAAYKLSINDALYVKPSVGFQGTYETGLNLAEKSVTYNDNKLGFGVLLGWGDQADAKAGVPFLDEDSSKKVTPGVSVVVGIPLATTSTVDDKKTISYSACKALIMPSIYSGEIEAGPGKLTAAAYSEIGLFSYIENASDRTKTEGNTTTKKGTAMKGETFAFALAAGVKYAVTLDNDATVTPQAGFRYVNGAYVGNGLAADSATSDIFKSNLGFQSKAMKDAANDKHYAGDFFNLKIGCDFGGFINNTTFSVNYNSANLLNSIGTEDTNPTYAKETKYYNVKAGQFDVGCKIAL